MSRKLIVTTGIMVHKKYLMQLSLLKRFIFSLCVAIAWRLISLSYQHGVKTLDNVFCETTNYVFLSENPTSFTEIVKLSMKQ